jgi:prophage maintenance system killer protein
MTIVDSTGKIPFLQAPKRTCHVFFLKFLQYEGFPAFELVWKQEKKQQIVTLRKEKQQ